MNFSTLFRTKENLSLDKNTLTILRYIAIFGQFLAIGTVYYYLNLPFPIIESYLIISLGLATNLYLQFGVKINQLKDFYAAPSFIRFDTVKCSSLFDRRNFQSFFLFIDNSSYSFLNIFKHGNHNYLRFHNINTFINHFFFSFTIARREYESITFPKFL